jgi:hypothetical protein
MSRLDVNEFNTKNLNINSNNNKTGKHIRSYTTKKEATDQEVTAEQQRINNANANIAKYSNIEGWLDEQRRRYEDVMRLYRR